MSSKIVVVGSANMDLIVKVPHIPAPGETVLGTEFLNVLGGKGANQAVAAARAGAAVTFISCVGDDVFGKDALKAYQKEKIDTQYIKIIEKVATGIALINVADSGENSISVAPGANRYLSPDYLMKLENAIAEASVVLMQLEIPMETIKIVADIAYKHGSTVILNPAPAHPLDGNLLEKVSIITPNEHEAKTITSSAHIDDIETLAGNIMNMGVKTTIITMGKRGAFCRQTDKQFAIEGIQVKAVDTTAAGDTFNGYLAAGLAAGKSFEKAVSLANKAAAISVTRIGAQPSIPYMHEISNL